MDMTVLEKALGQGGILGILALQCFVAIKYGIPLLRETVTAVLGFNVALVELRDAIETLRVEVRELRVRVNNICQYKAAGVDTPCGEHRPEAVTP